MIRPISSKWLSCARYPGILDSALQRFGEACLSQISGLTSLRLTVQPLPDPYFAALPSPLQRSLSMLRLLARLPAGLSEPSFGAVSPCSYPEAEAVQGLRCVARLMALTALVLPSALKPGAEFLCGTGGALPWRQLRSLELSIPWANVGAIWQLTELTRFVLDRADRDVTSPNASALNERSSGALAPLTALREFELRYIQKADMTDRDGGLARAIGGMSALSRLQFSFGSIQTGSVPPPVVSAVSSLFPPLAQLVLQFFGGKVAGDRVARLAARAAAASGAHGIEPETDCGHHAALLIANPATAGHQNGPHGSLLVRTRF